MLFSVDTYMIFLHLPTFAISRGSSRMTASFLLPACGLSTIFARLLTTLLSERKNVDGMVLFTGSFGLLALATFLFPIYSRTFPGLVIFLVILGAYFGGCYAVMNSINIHLVCVKYLSIATGMELVFSAVGTAIGPVITDVPDVDLIVPNNREVNETTSSMVASAHSHIKRGDDIGNEKQETERQEFTAEQKSLVCSGAACSTPDSARDSVFISSEEVDFSVEVQKLLK
ncbi:hypothetical protein MAR_015409, partial [Mya arenaria]